MLKDIYFNGIIGGEKYSYEELVEVGQVSFDEHVNLETEDLDALALEVQERVQLEVDKHRYHHPKGILLRI
jgi:hypothetical protein